MNTDTTYNPQVLDDSEEDEKYLALLIHQAGEDARTRTKKNSGQTFQKTQRNDCRDRFISKRNPPRMTDAQKPRLIVVAGPNGSGKTTIGERQ